MGLWALKWIVYLRDGRAASIHTVESYRQAIEQWLYFANQADLYDARAVTVHHVDDYLAWLSTRRLKPITVNHRRTVLRRFFRYLQREGAAFSNPVELTEPQKAPRGLPRGLSLIEQHHAIEVLTKTMHTPEERRDFALIATLFLAGLRCQEVATRRLEHVDLVTGTLHVHGKGNRERYVPLDARLREILRDYIAITRQKLVDRPVVRPVGADGRQRKCSLRIPDSGYLFVHARNTHRLRRFGEHLNTKSIYLIVHRRISPIIGRPISPHVLRHSLAQRLLDGSGDLQLVQAVLGHVNISTTQIYARMSTRAQREAFAKAMKATDEIPEET